MRRCHIESQLFLARIHNRPQIEVCLCLASPFTTCDETLLTSVLSNRDREHLKRVHRLEEHICIRCQTPFSTASHLVVHQRSDEPCELSKRKYQHPLKVEASVLDQLPRSNRGQTETFKWYTIWHRLFPSRTAPATPCMFAKADTRVYVEADSPIFKMPPQVGSLRNLHRS